MSVLKELEQLEDVGTLNHSDGIFDEFINIETERYAIQVTILSYYSEVEVEYSDSPAEHNGTNDTTILDLIVFDKRLDDEVELTDREEKQIEKYLLNNLNYEC